MEAWSQKASSRSASAVVSHLCRLLGCNLSFGKIIFSCHRWCNVYQHSKQFCQYLLTSFHTKHHFNSTTSIKFLFEQQLPIIQKIMPISVVTFKKMRIFNSVVRRFCHDRLSRTLWTWSVKTRAQVTAWEASDSLLFGFCRPLLTLFARRWRSSFQFLSVCTTEENVWP